MRRVMSVAAAVSTAGVWFGAGLLVLATIGITLEVVLRSTLAFSFAGVDELSGYALAVGSAWSFANALLLRAHIRIDTIYTLLPTRLRVAFDIVALLATLLFFGLVAWFGWFMLERTVLVGTRANTPLGTPLVYPQALWLLGIAVFLAVGLAVFAAAAAALLRGDWPGAAKLLGARSTTDEIEEARAIPAPPEPRR